MIAPEGKGEIMAYKNCKWCYGKGCLACEAEREKQAATPLFVAKNEEDIKLLGRYFNRKIVEEAYALKGGGTRELEVNLAVASVVQRMRQPFPKGNPTPNARDANNAQAKLASQDDYGLGENK